MTELKQADLLEAGDAGVPAANLAGRTRDLAKSLNQIPETAIAPIDPPTPLSLFGTSDPVQIIARATKVADALANVINKRKLYQVIGQRKYVLVEGWTLLGSLTGVFPRTAWVRPIEGGFEARVEAVTGSGLIVGAAEQQCTRSEKAWEKREDYALRGMAQTRATSRALRQPLGFILKLAGFEATAAEEMPTS